MLENYNQSDTQLAKTPEEEIAYLRAQIAEKERHIQNLGERVARPEVASAAVHQYAAAEATSVLAKVHPYHAEIEAGIKLPLSPERDDEMMAELLGVMMDSGVKKALAVLEGLHNPHLEDDFHRFLIQYLVAGLDAKDLSKDKELFRSINMKLYEVVMPELGGDKGFKDITALMEQFYASMMALSEGKNNLARNFYTLEVGLANGSHEVVFYTAVPRAYSDLFEKQIQALYPKARIIEKSDDYNVFNAEGASLGVYAKPSSIPALPIKLYTEFGEDPMNILLNTFAKFKRDGEGAAVQFVIMPEGDTYTKKYGETLDQLRKGKKLKDISDDDFGVLHASKIALSFFTGTKVEGEDKKETSYIDEDATRLVGEKISSTIMSANIRIVVSAENTERAQMMLREIQSAFRQFDEPKGNSIEFVQVKGRGSTHEFFKDFTYRVFDKKHEYPLNIKELASLYHFPVGVGDFAQLKQSQNTTAPAPIDLPQSGTLLGINKYRHLESPVYIGKEDRVRHFYAIGQTGTGKTGILKNMAIQDIKAGHGCCFIDPHGSDIQDILACIPPERMDDVIYFDPGDIDRPMGLNMLEYDARHPEQQSNVVDELLGIFNKLFDMKTAGGPAFEQYFRNASFTVMAHPESGNTLMDIGRVMSDKAFRDMKLSYVTNPLIKQFWANAEKTTGEAGLANFVPYITNKFDVFLSNDYMRPIVSQERSAFNFRDIMDGKKIFLANLAKGKLGDINSSLLGLIIVGKLTIAALSRVDSDAEHRPDFYLYIDEFQNFTTPSITTILSEARKYRLSLNVAHQYIGQLPQDIKDAVFGNVGSMAIFRVSVEDATFLEKYFEPTFTASDITKLENRNAYLKMLSNGNPQKPFNIVTVDSERGDREVAKGLKELSALRYGVPRVEVEAAMMKKFQKK